MKERPILFKSEMVRAILDGRKTQTRRTVKCNIKIEHISNTEDFALMCPYGQPGDRLWVRETWKYWDWTEDGMPWIKYAADDSVEFFDSCIPEEWAEHIEEVWAELSAVENYQIDKAARDHKWRPSIFMPRWASRIDLEITDVRVERLQDICEADAIAEGIQYSHALEGYNVEVCRHYHATSAVRAYESLWESINGPGSWDANPWVWVIEFRRIRP